MGTFNNRGKRRVDNMLWTGVVFWGRRLVAGSGILRGAELGDCHSETHLSAPCGQGRVSPRPAQAGLGSQRCGPRATMSRQVPGMAHAELIGPAMRAGYGAPPADTAAGLAYGSLHGPSAAPARSGIGGSWGRARCGLVGLWHTVRRSREPRHGRARDPPMPDGAQTMQARLRALCRR